MYSVVGYSADLCLWPKICRLWKGMVMIMDIMKLLLQNEELNELFSDICDIEIFPECKPPQDELGHLSYSISGKTFAGEKTGSEFILLEDGSVGFWGSEGQGGRIADSLDSFFALVINCPYWRDYIKFGPYEDREDIRELANELLEEYEEENEIILKEEQKVLAEGLGILLEEDISTVLIKFYQSAVREPRLIATYTEKDGSTYNDSGSLFKE